MESICEWCGLPYYPKYNNQKYCQDSCAKEAERENARIRMQKYRKKWRGLYGKNNKSTSKGTSHLGKTRCDDIVEELLRIQKEKARCGLSYKTEAEIVTGYTEEGVI